MKWAKKKETSACDCFCLKQQINDLLIFHTNMGRNSVKASKQAEETHRHTHTFKSTHTNTTKNWERERKKILSWVQCNTKFRLILTLAVLYQQQPKLPSKKILLSHLSDILWVCVCLYMRWSGRKRGREWDERSGGRGVFFSGISLTRRHLLF